MFAFAMNILLIAVLISIISLVLVLREDDVPFRRAALD